MAVHCLLVDSAGIHNYRCHTFTKKGAGREEVVGLTCNNERGCRGRIGEIGVCSSLQENLHQIRMVSQSSCQVQRPGNTSQTLHTTVRLSWLDR